MIQPLVRAGSNFVIEIESRPLGRELLQSLKAELAFLRTVVHSIDDATFADLGAPRPDAGYIQLSNERLDDSEFLRRQAIRSSTASVFRHFTQFIDEALAVKELNNLTVVVPRDLFTSTDREDYLREMIYERAYQIGKRHKLSAPEKYKQIVGTNNPNQPFVAKMFRLRAALEHHRGIASDYVALEFHTPVSGSEPSLTPAGDQATTYTFGFDGHSIVLDPGQPIALSMQDVEAIATTMIFRLAVQIIRAISKDKKTPVFTLIHDLIQQTSGQD